MIKQPPTLSEHLLSMTDDMYRYACEGDWNEVRAIDDRRHLLIHQVVDSGDSLTDSNLNNRLQETQEAILQMAIQERDRISTEFRATENKASHCNFYLKNNTE